jgi:hypothetical protein
MSGTTFTKPIDDSVEKVNGEVAVGEDLAFQRKWWEFERATWIFFGLILALDVAGFFGRGPVAKAQRTASDDSMNVRYDRIERSGTPTILTVDIGSSAIKNGRVLLYVSHSMVKELGAQRVIPAPERTVIGNAGLTYSFPVSSLPASVEFALEPTGPGLRHVTIQVPGWTPVSFDIFVVP